MINRSGFFKNSKNFQTLLSEESDGNGERGFWSLKWFPLDKIEKQTRTESRVLFPCDLGAQITLHGYGDKI